MASIILMAKLRKRAVHDKIPGDIPLDPPIPAGPGRQLGFATHYRQRAREALWLAREARSHGYPRVTAGYVSEALVWRTFACEWSRMARMARGAS